MTDRTPGSEIRVLRSESNTTLKRVRSLLRRKMRYQERAFLVEGVRSVADAIGFGVLPDIVLIDDEALLKRLGQLDLERVRLVEDHLLRSVSDVDHSQGVIAAFSMDQLPTSQIPVWSQKLIVVADGIRDPGNLGTLMRSAAGAGADCMLISEDSVDPFNPKCVRAAMGAHFRLQVEELDDRALAERLAGLPLIATADANGDLNFNQVDFNQDAVIVIGGEAQGPALERQILATTSVRIPLLREVESLNAAVAGSLLLFEVARQRRSGTSANKS